MKRKGIEMFNFGEVLTIKQDLKAFEARHPKASEFFNDVKAKTPVEGQEIAIAVRYPDGTEYKAGIKVTAEDLVLLNKLISLSKNI